MQCILKRLAWLALGWSLVLANTRRQKDQPSLLRLTGREDQAGADDISETDSTQLQQLEKQFQRQLNGAGFITKENTEDLTPTETEQKIKEAIKTEIIKSKDTQENQSSSGQEQDEKRKEALAETANKVSSTQHKHKTEASQKIFDGTAITGTKQQKVYPQPEVDEKLPNKETSTEDQKTKEESVEMPGENTQAKTEKQKIYQQLKANGKTFKEKLEEYKKSFDRNTTTVEEGQGVVGQNDTEKRKREDSAISAANNPDMKRKLMKERMKMVRESTNMGYNDTKPSYQMEYSDMMFKVSPPTNLIDIIREKKDQIFKAKKTKAKSGKKDKAKMMDRIKMNNGTENTNTTSVKDKKRKKNKQETKLTDSEGNPLGTEDKTTLKDKLKKKNKKNKNAENGETAGQNGTKGKSKKEKGKGKKKRKDKSKKKNEQPTSITASVSEMTTSSSAV